MRSWPRRLKHAGRYLFISLWFATWSTPAVANNSGFTVTTAKTRLVNDVYVVDSAVRYRFSEAMKEALKNGIPLTISLEIEFHRPRRYTWDSRVVAIRHDYRVEHHALTDQYLVADLITGNRRNFLSLAEAAEALGQFDAIPVVERRFLGKAKRYRGYLRTWVEIEDLPGPLRLGAYLSPGWWLSSGWYSWDFHT